MMIDDHNFKPGIRRHTQNAMGHRAAIHRDDEANAFIPQSHQRRCIGAIAFADPVGNINAQLAADAAEEPLQHRTRRCSVHVIITKDRNLLTGHNGRANALGSDVHILEHRGVRQQRLERGREIGRHILRRNAATGEHTPDDFRQPLALGNGQRRTIIRQTAHP